MSSIDDLELSVRTGNVLRAMNPDMTLDDFMALDRKTVLAQKNAGTKTWREIEEMQQHFKPIQREERRIVTGGPAFPILGSYTHDTWPGMSLRDAAALAALPAVARVCIPFECQPNETMEQMFARKAFTIADAFIAARETKET